MKRPKLETSAVEQIPRQLNYDSDELTERHPPYASDESFSSGSPIFFDLDDRPQPPSRIIEDHSPGKTKEDAAQPDPGDVNVDENDRKDDVKVHHPGSERYSEGGPHYSGGEPGFVFGGDIPPGAELGFRTAGNKPIHIEPNAEYLDIFKDSEDEDEVIEKEPKDTDLFGQFNDSQVNDDLLQSIANGE